MPIARTCYRRPRGNYVQPAAAAETETTVSDLARLHHESPQMAPSILSLYVPIAKRVSRPHSVMESLGEQLIYAGVCGNEISHVCAI